MTQSTLQTRQSERGFTLVELAIVMIIIGLLIGGILKGQELIENARVSSTVAQAKAVESGISGFRDKYAGFPGDLLTPNTRLPNCAAAMCNTAGDADGRVQTGTVNNPGAASAVGDEAAVTFVQLSAAGFVGGVDSAATALGVGTSHPETPIRGVWNFGYSDGVVAATNVMGAAGLLAGHYIVGDATPGGLVVPGDAVFKPAQAGTIDRKIDDGSPVSGTVRGIGTSAGGAADCGVLVGGVIEYQESNSAVVCGLYAKVQ